MCESPEICGCINAENLQDTTGSPGGDTSKSLKVFIYQPCKYLVGVVFAGTYFRHDKITIYCVCLLSRISQVNTGNSQYSLKIITNLSQTAKSMEVGTSETQYK